MGKQRPVYPAEYYSTLRKESNFGCAICGVPIPMEIHHIEGYKQGIVAPISELIYLCSYHHDDADHGKIGKDELYQYKTTPFNSYKVTHNFSIQEGMEMTVHIGSNRFINTPCPLVIDKDIIIATKRQNGQILLSTRFYDSNDKLQLELIDNVWSATTDASDVRYSEKSGGADVWLAIKMNDSEQYLDVKVKNGELHLKGNFYKSGRLYKINADGVFLANDDLLIMHDALIKSMQYGLLIKGQRVMVGGTENAFRELYP